jgi:hypothetical protein
MLVIQVFCLPTLSLLSYGSFQAYVYYMSKISSVALDLSTILRPPIDCCILAVLRRVTGPRPVETRDQAMKPNTCSTSVGIRRFIHEEECFLEQPWSMISLADEFAEANVAV